MRTPVRARLPAPAGRPRRQGRHALRNPWHADSAGRPEGRRRTGTGRASAPFVSFEPKLTTYLSAMRPEDLLCPTPQGLCCPPGGFHIDPLRPVERALITHGHSDHARPGHGAVMATTDTLDIMRLRCGENFAGTTQAAAYGETVDINGVAVTFRPAGHILGSAQICVE